MLKVVLKFGKLAFCIAHNGKLSLQVEVGCPVTNLTKLIYYEVNLKVEFANFNLRLRDSRNSRK